MLPWRVKNFLSNRCPLLYHLAINAGRKGNSAEHWDRQLADTWNHPSRRWPTKTEIIASMFPKDARILDVGCGNGSILRDLRGFGYSDLHGLEISSYAIARLRSEGIEMHEGILPAIPLPDHDFDLIIASQVLEHIVARRRFLDEIQRVLRPGGHALIFVPDNCLGPIDEPEHVIKYTSNSLRRFLARYFVVDSLKSLQDTNHPMPVLFALCHKPK